MSITALALAKSHSNIYFDDKDVELAGTLNAAEEFVLSFLNRVDQDGAQNLDGAVTGDSPARLRPAIEKCVLMAFDDMWQNKSINVTGTIVSENPTWLRCAHMFRIDLGV